MSDNSIKKEDKRNRIILYMFSASFIIFFLISFNMLANSVANDSWSVSDSSISSISKGDAYKIKETITTVSITRNINIKNNLFNISISIVDSDSKKPIAVNNVNVLSSNLKSVLDSYRVTSTTSGMNTYFNDTSSRNAGIFVNRVQANTESINNGVPVGYWSSSISLVVSGSIDDVNIDKMILNIQGTGVSITSISWSPNQDDVYTLKEKEKSKMIGMLIDKAKLIAHDLNGDFSYFKTLNFSGGGYIGGPVMMISKMSMVGEMKAPSLPSGERSHQMTVSGIAVITTK